MVYSCQVTQRLTNEGKWGQFLLSLILIMFLCVPACVQEMLACWRMWAGLLCYTDGPSCPMQPTPANAKAPAMRRRCSSTPGWLARTVLKGSCSTAPKHTATHHWTFLIYVNTHFPVMFVHFCLCVSMCRITVCDALTAASSSSLTVLRSTQAGTMQ